MPFDRSSSFKLMLAIAAALSAAQAHAANDERLWNCNLNAAGEWDCEVNEELMNQPEASVERSADSARDARAETTTTPAPAPEPEQVAEDRDTRAPVAVTPAPMATPAPGTSRPAVRPVRQPTRTATATAATSRNTRTASSQWDCQAVDGSWQCASPDQRTTAEADSRGGTSGDAVETFAGAGYDLWECAAIDGQWRCRQNSNLNQPMIAGSTSSRPVSQSFDYLDWYTYGPGDAAYGGVCPGEYREPDLGLMEANSAAEQQTIFLEALRSTTVLGGVTQLEGGINMRQGGRLLSSDRAEYYPEQRQAYLAGNVSYREQGMLLLADSAEADLNQANASFNDAEFVLHQQHLRGESARLSRFGDERFVMDRGRITFCEPGNDAWAIRAAELEIHTDEGYGEARHMRFEVADVPVFYLPYFYFPIDDRRRSGFLYPSLGYSDTDGADIATPYYFNIAPNIDDTFTPRYVSKRGLVLENELRYLNRWSMNQLSTAYMPDDDLFGDSRWALGFTHTGNPQPRWYTRIDYRSISDDDYLDDLDTTNLEITNEDDLDQLGEVRYQADTWQFTGRVHQYQTIDGGTEPYERIPQLLFSGRESALGGDAQLRYLAEYAYFDRNNEDLTGRARTVGGRLHLRPSASYRWERPWAWFEPRLTWWHSQYDLSDQPDSWGSSPNLSVPIFSVDSGIRLERDYGDSLTQTLEPRIKLISVDSEDQQELPVFDSSRLSFSYYNLFHETGYSGNDRVAGTNQATLGLSSAFYNSAGIEQARAGIAQAHYFEDRDSTTGLRPGDEDGTEKRSNLALLASWNITPNLRVSHDSELDDEDFEMVRQNYRVMYQPDATRFLYLSYRDNSGFNTISDTEEVRQADFAFRWPLSPAWGAIGRVQQDLLHKENLETLLGVEYSTCCWKVRLTGRQWVDDTDAIVNNENFERDTGIFLQFVLRGLGNIGQSGGREFLEDITGKDEDAHENF